MRGHKILIAEDDVVTRKLERKILEQAGYTTFSTSDGQMAWDVLQVNDDIELLVCDVQMPNLSGRDLIQRIRAEYKRELPVLVVSGTCTFSEIQSLMRIGANAFQAKPLRKDQLLENVELLLPL